MLGTTYRFDASFVVRTIVWMLLITILFTFYSVFPVIASNPVIIVINDSPDPVIQGQNITILSNVSDDIAVDSVWVEINGSNYTMTGPGEQSIFFEGFEVGNTDDQTPVNWTIINGSNDYWRAKFDNNRDPPLNGNWSVEARKIGANETILERNISSEGYQSLRVGFYYALINTESPDYLKVDYYNGSSWVNIFDTFNRTNYTFVNVSLGGDATNNSNFKLRFRCLNEFSGSENCALDDVNVSGIPITWFTSFNTTSFLPGIYNYTVYANDTSGNSSIPKTGNFTVIDTASPVISVVSPFNGTYELGAAITINYTNSSESVNLSSDVYRLDGGANVSFSNGSSTVSPGVGSHNLTIWAEDLYGNWGNDTVWFTVQDSTPPVITVESPTNTTTGDNTPLLNATFAGEIVNYSWFRTDGGATSAPVRGVSNLTEVLPALSDGGHNLTVYANDSFGNLANSTVWFTVDTTPPPTSPPSRGGGHRRTPPPTTIPPPTTTPPPTTIPPPTTTPPIITAAQNNSSNISVLDTVPPFIQYLAPTPLDGTYDELQIIMVSANDSNLENISLIVNNVKVHTAFGPDCTYNLSEDGNYTFRAIAIDTAGNTASTRARTINIHRTSIKKTMNITSLPEQSTMVESPDYFGEWLIPGEGWASIYLLLFGPLIYLQLFLTKSSGPEITSSELRKITTRVSILSLYVVMSVPFFGVIGIILPPFNWVLGIASETIIINYMLKLKGLISMTGSV